MIYDRCLSRGPWYHQRVATWTGWFPYIFLSVLAQFLFTLWCSPTGIWSWSGLALGQSRNWSRPRNKSPGVRFPRSISTVQSFKTAQNPVPLQSRKRSSVGHPRKWCNGTSRRTPHIWFCGKCWMSGGRRGCHDGPHIFLLGILYKIYKIFERRMGLPLQGMDVSQLPVSTISVWSWGGDPT